MISEKLKYYKKKPIRTQSSQLIKCEILQFDLEEQINNDLLLSIILEYRKMFPISRTSSIKNAWHSDYYFHTQVKDLETILLKQLESKIRQYFLPDSMELILLSSWPVVCEKNSYIKLHDHGITSLSVVYYVKADEFSPPLLFPKNDIIIQPKNGLAVMFPGYLEHSVPQSQINDIRVSIALNYYFNVITNDKNIVR